jgi:hypothetical protein
LAGRNLRAAGKGYPLKWAKNHTASSPLR